MPDLPRHGDSLELRLDRYWDAVLAGAGDPPGAAIDPDLAATVRRAHALDATSSPPPGFAATLWDDLMHAPATAVTPGASSAFGAPQRLPTLLGGWKAERAASSLSRVAAAILLVALLAGTVLAALYPLRPRGGGIPLVAQSETPTVVPAETDATKGAIEFLWESNGGPDPLVHPFGIGVDSEGNVWVADGYNDRFQILSADGTFLESWGTPGSAEGQFDFRAKYGAPGADYGDIAFDAAGNMYVADAGNFRVQKFAPDRSFLRAWGGLGEEDGQFMAPNTITVGADGMIYVSDNARHDVQRFDADGNFLGKMGGFGQGEGQLSAPGGAAVIGNGVVLVADFGNSRMQRFNADGDPLGAWGREGAGQGEIHDPQDVSVDASARVYVVDMNSLQVFAPDGRFLAEVGALGTGPGQFFAPASVAVDADGGVIYITDRDRVQAFRNRLPAADDLMTADPSVATPAISPPASVEATGSTVGTLEFLWESTGGPEPLVSPYGLGIDPAGNIWVADGDNDRFQIFAPDGSHLETWGTAGSGEGQFEFLSVESSFWHGYGDIAFDAEGNLYVADSGNQRVQKFAPDRTFLLAWGGKGKGDGQFLTPSSIAIGPDGAVYVSDEDRHDVQKFDADGRYMHTIGERGSEEGQLIVPAGVTVDGDGNVWVADFENHRIQRFSPDGEWLATWGQLGFREGELHNPNDVAVDEKGRVYVADTNNSRIQVFTPEGQSLGVAGAFGSDPGEFNGPAGIAVDPNGVVYASDTTRIQAFAVHVLAGDETMP